uniref:Receptor-like serine/threonine-protein kinase n=1 Tax=Cannabis sativa TaxID=3483 RepID=A0A803PX12_CANSA
MLLCWTNAANITLGSSLTAKLNHQNEESSWLSPNGDFSFGFQQIQKDGFLLAIWFNKVPEKTIVWSANRDNLVQQGSIVELTKVGSLALRDSTGKEVWSTGFGVDHAAMLNTGNFVLANKDFSNNWESFNEPTDTLLPTQVLTTTKQLIASYSKSNYSRGRYLMTIDDGDLVLFSRRPPQDHESIYWPENLIDGRSTGQGISFQVMFNKSGSIYVQAGNGTILKWLSQSNSSSSTSGLYQRAILEYDGVFRHYVYPKDDDSQNSTGWPLSIDNDGRPSCYCPNGYTFIDSNDKMKGCIPIFEAQSCNDDLEDYKNFYIDSIDFLNWPLGDYESFQSVSEDWCRNACLVDCFCPLAIFGGNKCYKIAAPLTNGMMDSSIQGTKSLVKIRKGNSTASKQCNNLDSKRKVDKTTLIVIGSVIISSSAVLNILLLITSLVFCFRLRRKASITKPNQNILEMNLQNFSFVELEKATNGFEEQLGAGAFGVVYKGVVELDNNNITSIIAVKKLYNNNMVKEGEQEFKAEVMSIGSTNHKNLVKLIGFCNEGQHRLLVYEYMSNGSLASFLFGPSKPSWHQRKQLALGIARGLFYLHEECSTQIIHCDIKPQNILLDHSFTARISDFGLAKILKTDQTRTTTGIRGTKGYVAPEWFRNMAVTVKVDVYSYGILLLELICCRKNVEANVEDDAQIILADWACDCYEAGKVECLVENDDEAKMEMKMVEKYVMVALWCIQEDPSLRPTMKKVMLMLEGSENVSAPPLLNSVISSL